MAQNANENNVLPNKTKVDHYIIESHIGHGGYGEIYSVYDENHKGPWAMKVEMKSAKKHGLTEEIHYLKMLRGSPMFPEYICNGETNELRYFIMELLGPSVSFVRRSLPDLRYSQLTATILAKEMLKCIEELHKRGYVHRDIKPGNFLIRPNRQNPIVLIDFGLSRRYADRETMKPLPPRHNPGFIGTCSFASLNAHEGKELGRRDDIFSWIYTVIEMVDKRLPWPGSKDREKTYRLKQTIRPYDLCHSLPRAFTTIYVKTIGYQFEDKPDYQGFYKLLDKAIQDLGGYGKPFDWEKLPPETISRISAISLDMGPLNSTEADDKDNNKKENADKNKDNNGRPPKPKNDENQSKSKNTRDKPTNNEPKNQNTQENNNQKKTPKKTTSNANTTTATNETNTTNRKQSASTYNKQEETVPEDNKKIPKIDDDDDNNKSGDSNKQLRTAPPRGDPKPIKKVKKNTNINKDESRSNSRSVSDPNAHNNSDKNVNKSDDENLKNKNSDDDSYSGSSYYSSDPQQKQQKQTPQQQQQQPEKTQTDPVNNRGVNNNGVTEEPDNGTNKNKGKKKKGKSDHEPGCKACIIA